MSKKTDYIQDSSILSMKSLCKEIFSSSDVQNPEKNLINEEINFKIFDEPYENINFSYTRHYGQTHFSKETNLSEKQPYKRFKFSSKKFKY